jgi:magnesium transporter
MTARESESLAAFDESHVKRIVTEVEQRAPSDAVKLLENLPDLAVVQVLGRLNPSIALNVLLRFETPRRQSLLYAAPADRREQWIRNQAYSEGSVGRLMEPPTAVFSPDHSVQQAVDALRELVKTTFVTYGYVTDADGRFIGVLVMRDLLLAQPGQRLQDVMVRQPFSLSPSMPVSEATKEVLHRHYPVYPVCDEKGRLVGLVRGYVLFEEQTLEISAQPGRMVGVEEEERLSTHWVRSLRSRHPWLQLNLLTAFLAAAVVGIFEHTINQIVAVAVFLPVLAGQSGNTGCQALAVTLRGITLGEMPQGRAKVVVSKEAWLGLLNGGLVGMTAALGMYVYARTQGHGHAGMLAIVVFLAMVGSCLISGLSGALVPLGLKRLGADPATASSIFLTTATDVASMGLFLWLATLLVL